MKKRSRQEIKCVSEDMTPVQRDSLKHRWINAINQLISNEVDELYKEMNSPETLEKTIVDLDDYLDSKINEALSTTSTKAAAASSERGSSWVDQIHLNIGGYYVSIDGNVLLNPAITWNWFSALFHPRWDAILPRDKNDRIYLEMPYQLIEPILETYRVAALSPMMLMATPNDNNARPLYNAFTMVVDVEQLPSLSKLSCDSGEKYGSSGDLMGECTMKLLSHIMTTLPSTLTSMEELAAANGWSTLETIVRGNIDSLRVLPHLNSIIVDAMKDELPLMKVPLLRPYHNRNTPSVDKPMLVLGVNNSIIVGILWTPLAKSNSTFARFTIEWNGQSNKWEKRVTEMRSTINTLTYCERDGVSITLYSTLDCRLPFMNLDKTNNNRLCCLYRDYMGTTREISIVWVEAYEILSNLELQSFTTTTSTSNSVEGNYNELNINADPSILAFDAFMKQTHQELLARRVATQGTLDKRALETNFIELLHEHSGLKAPETAKPDIDQSSITSAVIDEALCTLHARYDQLALYASPSHQALKRDDVIFFNVHDTTICLLKSTILEIIPDSQLAIRFCSGDWQEQESTLDSNGHVIVNYPKLVFLPFIEFLRTKRMFKDLMVKCKTIYYPTQAVLDIAKEMLSYYAVANIAVAVKYGKK